MSKLIMTIGLPGSGKTTWAKDYQKKNPNTVLVNKDELRAMLHQSVHSHGREDFVLKIRDHIIREALSAGHDIIVHDTNFADKHQTWLEQMAKAYKAEFVVQYFTDVSLDECIKRDQKRPNYVGEKVIRKMYNDYLAPKVPVITHDPALPDAILCDLDGTLALFPGRNPYERDFINDIVNPAVKKVLDFWGSAADDATQLIFVSGRKGKFLAETEKWLKKNDITYQGIFMPRADDDNRKDVIIKQEIYEQHIKSKYNVLFILDDRNQVVDFWRSQGLTCLQVAPGDF